MSPSDPEDPRKLLVRLEAAQALRPLASRAGSTVKSCRLTQLNLTQTLPIDDMSSRLRRRDRKETRELHDSRCQPTILLNPRLSQDVQQLKGHET